MDTGAPFERAQRQKFDDASLGRGKYHVGERAAVRPNDHRRSLQMTAVHLVDINRVTAAFLAQRHASVLDVT